MHDSADGKQLFFHGLHLKLMRSNTILLAFILDASSCRKLLKINLLLPQLLH